MPKKDPLMTSHLKLASACLAVSQQIAAVRYDDLRALLRQAGLDPDPVRDELKREHDHAWIVDRAARDLHRAQREAQQDAREIVPELIVCRSRLRDLANMTPDGPEAAAAARTVRAAMGEYTKAFRGLHHELRRLVPAAREAEPWLPLITPELPIATALLARADTIEAALQLARIHLAAAPRGPETDRLRERLRTVVRQWRFAQRFADGRLPDLVLADLEEDAS